MVLDSDKSNGASIAIGLVDKYTVMKRYLLTLASLLALLAGCAAPPPSLVPTPYPPEYLPTVIALTANAVNASGTETALASIQTEVPSKTALPTLTFTPQPTHTSTPIPWHRFGAIRFVSPGPMSKVLSPIQLHMEVISGESQKVQVDLYGEDGRLLARELRKVLTTGKGAVVSIRIPFETRAAAELGRITVSTLDKEGRIQSLNSLRLLLLSSGVNEINRVGDPAEPVVVFRPRVEETVSGGVVNVKVDIWPFNLEPVVLELVDSAGKSLGLRILSIEEIKPQLFETTIPYKVSEPTPVRLVVRQDDDRMPGVYYIYTQLILLNP
jgi:hypothetical protein